MISRIRVQNFKSIADVNVELSPVTVLVGRSGTGKSSFVQAIRFLRDVLVAQQPQQQSWPLLQHLNPSVSSVELDDIQIPKSVVVGHTLDGKTLAFNLSHESDGFRRFYAHLLAIYQRPPKQTLVFEHPIGQPQRDPIPPASVVPTTRVRPFKPAGGDSTKQTHRFSVVSSQDANEVNRGPSTVTRAISSPRRTVNTARSPSPARRGSRGPLRRRTENTRLRATDRRESGTRSPTSPRLPRAQ